MTLNHFQYRTLSIQVECLVHCNCTVDLSFKGLRFNQTSKFVINSDANKATEPKLSDWRSGVQQSAIEIIGTCYHAWQLVPHNVGS